jgi:phospholipase A1
MAEIMRFMMKKTNATARLVGALLCASFGSLAAPAAYAASDVFLRCAQQYPGNDAERLKCYDRAALPVSSPEQKPDEDVETSEADMAKAPVHIAERSYLDTVWNLDNRTNRDESKMGRLRPHRQSYLIVRETSNPNRLPNSPAIGHSTLTPNDLDALETKFQLSFKGDIGSQRDINILGFKTFRMWGAYTQQSSWQVLNSRNSSPFRETNYEPELIATFGTGNASGLKLVNLGWAHQSNGHTLPESRSWNRVYLQGGWEWGNTSVMARGWYRIPENALYDDNPDITAYIGLADMVARWEPLDKTQSVTLLLRNNLRLGSNRGFMQLD